MDKEALFYEKLADKKVKCVLCNHFCIIGNNQRGVCKVRENREGILYSLVYGKIVAKHIDPIEKKPLFNFLPKTETYSISTVGCNFRCLFCQNFDISQPTEIIGIDTTPEEVVSEAIKYNCPSISYTYTEPTVFFEFAYDTAKLAKQKGLKNIFVTNGYMSSSALQTIQPYLDAANVDLKSMSDGFYRKICGGSLQPVLNNLKEMIKLKIWVEVTTLIIPGLNDSEEELSNIARFIKDELGENVPWHVSAFFPTYKMLDRPCTPPETVRWARDLGKKIGLQHVYTGNIVEKQ
jgi:pyruvate formate lyase activating enzyme